MVFRGAERLASGAFRVTYACGLATRERVVIARVTRHERQTFIDWIGGEAPDEIADDAVRFGLTACVEGLIIRP